MTSTITYDGVASAVGGNIFQNKKFWLSHRVPQRARFVDDIQNNGGSVVPLEKQADYLIADHARKDCPPGSFSWRFIEDSVKNGILQLEDRYRIGRDPDLPRPAGSAGLGKGSRTPFTTADDHALVKWVLSHKTNRLGNAIYQEFEEQNPRHTWQSWLNRWKKVLSILPTARLEEMAESAPSLPKNPPQTETTRARAAEQPTNHQKAERGDFGKPQKPRSPPRAQRQAQQERAASPPQPKVQQQQQAPEPQPEPPANEEEEEEQDEEEDAKSRFYADLTEFAQSRQLSIQLQPTIGGKRIELWDLVQAVNSQDAAPEDVDWSEVAVDMGFIRSIRDLTTQLQQCWEDNLAEFLEAMAEYAEENEDEDEDEEELPSSPPAPASGRKRSLDEVNQSSPQHQKRRRLDPNAEIPSTPDEKLKVIRPRQQDESPATPARAARLPQDEIKDSQDDTQAVLRTPKNQPPALETQESSFDVTPSQQLRYENRLSSSSQPGDTDVDPGRRDQATSSPEAEPTLKPQRQAAASTPTQKRPAKPVRRTLPASFGGPSRPIQQQQPQPQPQQQQQRPTRPEPNPDTHDPGNDPDPHPKRDIAPNGTLEGWIEYYQSMGYPLDAVVTALNCTTYTPGIVAGEVMESLKNKQGIPQNYQGVWTNRDDRSLGIVDAAGEMNREAVDAEEHQVLRKARREWKRLVNKHGEEAIDLRRQFLEAKGEQNAAA